MARPKREIKTAEPSQSREAWGKHSPDGSYHPLADHCMDVAIVFEHLLAVPNLARLGDLSVTQKQRLAVVAFLHDFGKCNRGFQAKAEPSARDTAGHIMEAFALLKEPKAPWPRVWTALITELIGWFTTEEQAYQMLLASISHHGRPVSPQDYNAGSARYAAKRWWSPDTGYDPLAALDELAKVARRAFTGAFGKDVPPIDATPTLQQRFAGLVMLSDWIGSDTQFFPYRKSRADDRLAFAQVAAQRALQAIGLVTPEPREVKPFVKTFSFVPNQMQATLTDTLEVGDDTRLLLVESDTGSGKTEAALAWFFRLYAQHKVDGLYFALPTRVAATELYERVRHAVDAAFEPETRPNPVLLAVPGYTKVDGVTPPILPRPQDTLWDDNAQDMKRERFWSAERPKRFLAAPIAVGTIDQALLSVLQVKHSLMRSVCLDRHLLVVDEVHASDLYMREVLRTLLRGHRARGGWTLLLSATLGESAAALYLEREPASLAKAITRPYPLLSTYSRSWPMPEVYSRRVRVELAPTIEDDVALLPALIQALEAGARVLVVCNTVKRANALFRLVEATLQTGHPRLLTALFALDSVRCPHHGRFAREDRKRLDAAITAQMGKGSPDGTRLIIATQTLEQSLDIDGDWLVTDLAPMDILLQRCGRLHRHPRAKRPPGFETPRALIRVPPRDLVEYLDYKGELRAPAGLGAVYADGRALACTWTELQREAELELPRKARALIERTTHNEAFDALPESWKAHSQLLHGRILADIVQALRSVLDDKPFGDLHYADKSEHVLTRLGQPMFEVPLRVPMRSPFGVKIHRVTVPARWLNESALSEETICAETTTEGFRFSIGKTGFRYTRFGLEKDDA